MAAAAGAISSFNGNILARTNCTLKSYVLLRDADLHLRGSVMASPPGPMAFEAALANFANSGLGVPESLVDGDALLGGPSELDFDSSFQAPKAAEKGMAAGQQAAKPTLKVTNTPLEVSKEVCTQQYPGFYSHPQLRILCEAILCQEYSWISEVKRYGGHIQQSSYSIFCSHPNSDCAAPGPCSPL